MISSSGGELVLSRDMYRIKQEADDRNVAGVRITSDSVRSHIEWTSQGDATELGRTIKEVNRYVASKSLTLSDGGPLSQSDINYLRGNLLLLNKARLAEGIKNIPVRNLILAFRMSFLIPAKVSNEEILDDMQKTLLYQQQSRLVPSKNWVDFLQLLNQVICYEEIVKNQKTVDYGQILGGRLAAKTTREQCLAYLRHQLTLQTEISDKILRRIEKVPELSSKIVNLFNWSMFKIALPRGASRECGVVIDRRLLESVPQPCMVGFDQRFDEIVWVPSEIYPSYCKKSGYSKGEMESKIRDKLLEVLSDPQAFQEEIGDFESLYNLFANLEGILSRGLYYEKEKTEKILFLLDEASQKYVQARADSLLTQRDICTNFARFKDYQQRLDKFFSKTDNKSSFSKWVEEGGLKDALRDRFAYLITNYFAGLTKPLEVIYLQGEFDEKVLLAMKEKYSNLTLAAIQNELCQPEFELLLKEYFGSDFSYFEGLVDTQKKRVDELLGQWEQNHVAKLATKHVREFAVKVEEARSFSDDAKLAFFLDFITPIYSSFIRLEEYVACIKSLPEEKQIALHLDRAKGIKENIEAIYKVYTKGFPENFLRAIQYRSEFENFRQAFNAGISSLPKISPGLLQVFVDAYSLENPGVEREELLERIQQNPSILCTITASDGSLLCEKISRLYDVNTGNTFRKEELSALTDAALGSWTENLYRGLPVLRSAITNLVELGTKDSKKLKEQETYKKAIGDLKDTSIGTFQVLYDPFLMSFQLVTSRIWMPIENYIKILGQNHPKHVLLMTVYQQLKELSIWANLNNK